MLAVQLEHQQLESAVLPKRESKLPNLKEPAEKLHGSILTNPPGMGSRCHVQHTLHTIIVLIMVIKGPKCCNGLVMI